MNKIFCYVLFIILINAFLCQPNDVIQLNNKNEDESLLKEIELKLSKITCSVNILETLYNDYRDLYNNISLEEAMTKYGCEKIHEDIFNEEEVYLNLDIKKEETGSATANLIIFGHYIEPPYNIDYKPSFYYLALNGVDLWPSILTEAEDIKLNFNNQIDIYTFNILVKKYMIEVTERKYIDNMIKDYQHHDIYIWKKKYTTQLLSNLVDDLNTKVSEGLINNYYIYDEDKLLFDICGYYSASFFNVPNEAIKKYINRNSNNNLSLKSNDKCFNSNKYNKARLEERFRKYNNIINDSINNNITMVNIQGSIYKISLEQFKKILYVLKSKNQKYKKMCVLEDILGVENSIFAREILYNFDENEYKKLIEKLNIK